MKSPFAVQYSNLAWKEVISASQIGENPDVLRFTIPPDQPERRIYLYLEAALSAVAAYQISAHITLTNGGQIVSQLPTSIADLSGLTPNQSVLSLLNCGGSPVGDSIAVRLAQKINTTSPDVIVMQPIRLNAVADEIRLGFSVTWGTTLTGFRALLACLSTRY